MRTGRVACHTSAHHCAQNAPQPTRLGAFGMSRGGAGLMPMRVCSTPGCPTLHRGHGRCPSCATKADRERRPHGNPYSTRGHQAFREAVLTHDPVCVCTGDCGRHDGLCARPSTIADHYPDERVDLAAAGLDPDDPERGRGVCKPCHDAKTARTKPSGWNERDA